MMQIETQDGYNALDVLNRASATPDLISSGRARDLTETVMTLQHSIWNFSENIEKGRSSFVLTSLVEVSLVKSTQSCHSDC